MAELRTRARGHRDAYDHLRHEMLDALKERSLDADNEAHAQAISDLAGEPWSSATSARPAPAWAAWRWPIPPDMVARLIRSVINWGVLTELLERRDVEEIFIKGARRLVPRRLRPPAEHRGAAPPRASWRAS